MATKREIEALARFMHAEANTYIDKHPKPGDLLEVWSRLQKRSRECYRHVAKAILEREVNDVGGEA
jgi:hypothetical protein